MPSVHYRRARPSDAEAIAGLLAELGYPVGPAELKPRLERLGGGDHAVFVAEQGAELIGCVHARADIRLAEGAAGEIASLVVKSGRRGGGVGTALVNAATAWLAEHGHRSIRIRANAVREAAHGFYRSLGFACVKTQHVFQKTLDRP